MLNQNIVVFKGKKDGITIIIDENANFDDVKEVLGKKVTDAKKFFGGAKAAIDFNGRRLSDYEEEELLRIISENANLDISFVTVDANRVVEVPPPKEEKIEATVCTMGDPGAPELHLSEHITKYHMSSLRSGQSIRFSGSVVVVGDVNPGAEVIAEGNIIVLGLAKGLVHAGCTGNTECFISAVGLIPIQLRIADIITCIPDNMDKNPKKTDSASYAYIRKGQIYIAPLVDDRK